MRDIGEVVLVYFKDQPAFFARIEEIEIDNVKRGWYHVTLLMLAFPVHNIIWTLREEYIDGEIFTMNGFPMRIETVEKVLVDEVNEEPIKKNFGKKGNVEPAKKNFGKKGNVIPFRKPSKK